MQLSKGFRSNIKMVRDKAGEKNDIAQVVVVTRLTGQSIWSKEQSGLGMAAT